MNEISTQPTLRPTMMPAIPLKEATALFTDSMKKRKRTKQNETVQESSTLEALLWIAQRLTDTKPTFTENDFLSLWRAQGLEERISMESAKHFFFCWTDFLVASRKLQKIDGAFESIWIQLN